MLRISVVIIISMSQVVLFAQSKTDSISARPNQLFLQFGYIEDNSLVEDRSFGKISGFNTSKLGLIRNHSEKVSWGYNLIHFKGVGSYTDSLDHLVVYSDGSIRIETLPVIAQEELALIGMDVSYYRAFLLKNRINLGVKFSAGYSHKRRESIATYQVNIIDNSLGLKANFFSMYKLNDRIDLYMDLNLLKYNLVIRNTQFIDGDTIRNDGTFGYGEFDLLGKSIVRIHLGIAYNF